MNMKPESTSEISEIFGIMLRFFLQNFRKCGILSSLDLFKSSLRKGKVSQKERKTSVL